MTDAELIQAIEQSLTESRARLEERIEQLLKLLTS